MSEKPKMVERSVRVVLTNSELLDYGEKIAQQLTERSAAESRKASFNAQIKSTIEMCDASISRYRNAISEKAEYREMLCEQRFDFVRRKVEIIHPQNGEIIESRDMTAKELQLELAMDPAASSGETVVETIAFNTDEETEIVIEDEDAAPEES